MAGIKINSEKFNKLKGEKEKKKSTLLNNPKKEIVIPTTEIDVSTIVKAINNIADSMNKINDQSKPTNNNEKIVQQIAEKIDKLTGAITKRNDQFEFDIKRNEYGFISKVLVKPVKE